MISRRSRQTHESRSAIHCGEETCIAAPSVPSSEQFFSPMRSFMTSIPGVLNSMRSGQCELHLSPKRFPNSSIGGLGVIERIADARVQFFQPGSWVGAVNEPAQKTEPFSHVASVVANVLPRDPPIDG